MAEKKTQPQVGHFCNVTGYASRSKRDLRIIVFVLLITGCVPLETIPTATQILPTPAVRVTHAATATTIPTAAPLATLAKIPIPKSDIAQLADDLYGSRVIEQISIPALNVNGKVVPVGWRVNFSDNYQSGEFEWDSPDSHVGWVITSALPDETGNVILYGHNNLYEKIFENLADLSTGDRIYLQTGDQRWEYEVRNILLLPIVGASKEQLNKYQKYLKPTQDAQVTLISCWPPVSNTHRVVVIGQRVSNP
jgi:LPXTG-site transpeptidase (sortase) family protein